VQATGTAGGYDLVEATHSLLLSRKKHMDILGKMGVMPVSARKSIGGRDNEQVWCFSYSVHDFKYQIK